MAASDARVVKVLLLGDSGVGKSSIVDRYCRGKFIDHYTPTIGADFAVKEVMVGDQRVTMKIWDTAGQERYSSLGITYYRGTQCCVLVFDVTVPESFKALNKWKDEFVLHANPTTPARHTCVVLGNKIDLENREVTSDEARRWCLANGDIPYFETSAIECTNVDQVFQFIAMNIVLHVTAEPDFLTTSVRLEEPKKRRKKSQCC
ncbi:ras-related protein rab7-like [Ptychodera flava]|uniref:ras-related protein rab7-like n=1 Tax=Ptychodera flava TaxID=63121 RepID=UPI00396A8571